MAVYFDGELCNLQVLSSRKMLSLKIEAFFWANSNLVLSENLS
jgi:hypothetical protein